MKTNFRRLAVKLSDEPDETQRQAGRYNPAQCLSYKRRRFILSAGRSDNVFAWSANSGGELYVMSLNSRLGYAGIEFFNVAYFDGEKEEVSFDASTFFQNVNQELSEELNGEDFFDLSDEKQRDILAQYI